MILFCINEGFYFGFIYFISKRSKKQHISFSLTKDLTIFLFLGQNIKSKKEDKNISDL